MASTNLPFHFLGKVFLKQDSNSPRKVSIFPDSKPQVSQHAARQASFPFQ